MTDVIVVGGGPAGAALATFLAKTGMTVDLFDQCRFPRDKPCGEGILPPGVDVLDELGLLGEVGGQLLEGVSYHLPRRTLSAGFPSGPNGLSRPGLGQRRTVLDECLWRAAAASSGVRVHEQAAVQGLVVQDDRVRGISVGGRRHDAEWVVAADGANSRIRRSLGLERIVDAGRQGVRAHFSCRAELPNRIQVFFRHGYEIYLTPLPRGELLVAALAHREAVSRLPEDFERWCRREPLLNKWLDGARQSSPLKGRAPLQKELARGKLPCGVTFVGDAACSVDPVTAGGVSLALSTARELATYLPRIMAEDGSALRRFERARSRAVLTHRMLGGSLLALSRHPLALQGAGALLSAWPAALRTLVGSVASPRARA